MIIEPLQIYIDKYIIKEVVCTISYSEGGIVFINRYITLKQVYSL